MIRVIGLATKKSVTSCLLAQYFFVGLSALAGSTQFLDATIFKSILLMMYGLDIIGNRKQPVFTISLIQRLLSVTELQLNATFDCYRLSGNQV